MSQVPSSPAMILPVEADPRIYDALRNAGVDPREFAIIGLQAEVAIGMTTEVPRLILIQAQAVVPHAALPVAVSSVLDAQGNAMASRELQAALPFPPVLHVIVRRAALAPEIRSGLEAAQEQAAEQQRTVAALASVLRPPPPENM